MNYSAIHLDEEYGIGVYQHLSVALSRVPLEEVSALHLCMVH
jgi:hypothetical protein